MPTAVTIGVYDGIHLGHREIFKRCIERAKEIGGLSVVVTFEPLPLSVLAPGCAPARIATLAQKERFAKQLGIDIMLVVKFDEHFAAMPAHDFVETILSDKLNAGAIVVGENFHFGRGREGSVDYLRKVLAPRGITVEAVELLVVDGDVVSSTRIRKLIRAGQIEAAAALLGRYPVAEGVVIKGLSRGRQLGFPTVNLDVENEGAVPCCGVFAGYALLDDERLPAVIDVGRSPTFGDVMEVEYQAHIIDFSGDLYGRKIEIEVRAFIRKEMAFESVEALIAQIASDVEKARQLLDRAMEESH